MKPNKMVMQTNSSNIKRHNKVKLFLEGYILHLEWSHWAKLTKKTQVNHNVLPFSQLQVNKPENQKTKKK